MQLTVTNDDVSTSLWHQSCTPGSHDAVCYKLTTCVCRFIQRLSDYNAQQLLSYFGSSFFVLIFTLVFLQLCYATEMVTAVMSMTCLSGEQTANHGSRITPLNMPSGNTLQWASGNHIQHYSVVLVLLVLSISVTEQNVGRLQQCKRNRRWAIMTGTMLTLYAPMSCL